MTTPADELKTAAETQAPCGRLSSIPTPCSAGDHCCKGPAAADLAPVEYLYELWDANWDDGPLGNWQIHRHEITRKTAKRIYFTHRHRAAFVDRQQIEADGEIFYRPAARTLYLTEPDIPHRPKTASLPELKQAMADAHPDRGGTDEAFIAARQRYERARAVNAATHTTT